MKWEYKIRTIKLNPQLTVGAERTAVATEELNPVGSDGLEIISAIPMSVPASRGWFEIVLFMKRPAS